MIPRAGLAFPFYHLGVYLQRPYSVMVKSSAFGNQTIWIWILALSPNTCVNLGKLLHGDNNMDLT